MQSAWKVGLFVLIFIGLVIAGYTLVGNSLFKKPVDIYYGEFEDVGGVQPGAVITMVGVKIGTVTDVSLVSPKKARMTLAIQKDRFVPADAQLSVPSNLFSLGEQRLELVSEKGFEAGRLPPGSTLPGLKGSVLKSVLPEGEATIKQLNETLKAMQSLLGDEGLRDRIKAVLDSTNQTVKSLDLLMKDSRSLIAQNRGTLRAALLSAAQAVEDLRMGIRSVTAQLTSADVDAGVRSMLDSLNATAHKAEELVTQLNAFMLDPNLKNSLNATLTNAETISRTGIDIAENSKAITENGKIATAKAIELTESAKEIADEAKSLLAKLNELVGRLPGGGLKVAAPTLQLETARNLDTDLFQTDVFIRYPLGPVSSIFAGVNDVTESNNLTAQYAQHFGPNSLRYGVYASKPGVGVDWNPTPRLSFSGDLFDPNDLKLNLRARFLFGSDIYGWLGLDRLFERNQPLIGIGVRR